MDFASTIKRIQAKLGLPADGIAGPKTWSAIENAVGSSGTPVDPVWPAGESVDPRSESNIDALLPVVRPMARELVRQANAALPDGVVAKVTSGFRSYSEQAQLYQKYQDGGPQAAPPGYSNHNFALAIDITLFNAAGQPLWESPLYRQVGQIGKSIGFIWGGDWSGSDEPHFEFRPAWAKDYNENQALAQYRERQKNGIAIA